MFTIFETLEYKFHPHFSENNVLQCVLILWFFAIVAVFVSSVSWIYRFCGSLERSAHKRPYRPCAYVFLWFCFVCVSHNNCFRDSRKSNDASLTMFAIYSCSTYSKTLTSNSMWTISEELRARPYLCGRDSMVLHIMKLFHAAFMNGVTNYLFVFFCFCCVWVSHENFIRNCGKSNNASLRLVVIQSFRPCFEKPASLKVWTVCDALRTWPNMCSW